ncbi:hypothetical protein B0H16DRAFT_804114 [Mycena metata]|uniref:Uncharacterized protein n=1 Tax=Mycena metata TaxID=1033252 RepID=A0AAD7KAK5_9AGAR|nr:hypothetical protein B0H16DRAFT_804114 [Mycena metata]
MPRKAAADADAAEPRRSTRIKDLPKVDPPVKKAPAKPRAKKEPKEGDEEKPKRGRKRKEPAADAEDAAEENGEAEDGEPPAKKAKPASKAAGSKPASKAASVKPATRQAASSPPVARRPRSLHPRPAPTQPPQAALPWVRPSQRSPRRRPLRFVLLPLLTSFFMHSLLTLLSLSQA